MGDPEMGKKIKFIQVTVGSPSTEMFIPDIVSLLSSVSLISFNNHVLDKDTHHRSVIEVPILLTYST